MVRFTVQTIGAVKGTDDIDIKAGSSFYNASSTELIANQPFVFDIPADEGSAVYALADRFDDTGKPIGWRNVKVSNKVSFKEGGTYYYIYPLNLLVEKNTAFVGLAALAAFAL